MFLFTNLAKIFERVIHKRLIAFLNKYNISADNHFRFVKNKGTKDALGHITHIIYNNLDNSISVPVTFLDLTKTFDTVNHRFLLEKLYDCGIINIAFALLENYLTNRKQRVRIGNVESKYKNISTETGRNCPLLFII